MDRVSLEAQVALRGSQLREEGAVLPDGDKAHTHREGAEVRLHCWPVLV